MKKIAACLLFVVVVLSPTASAATENAPPTAESTAVRIRTVIDPEMGIGAIGCGTIMRGGNIITAAHVLGEAKAVMVIDSKGRRRFAASWKSIGKDVAIIVLESAFPQAGLKIHRGKLIGAVPVTGAFFWGQGHSDGRLISYKGWAYPLGEVPEGMKDLGGPYLPAAIPMGRGASGHAILVNGEIAGVLTGGHARGGGSFYYWSLIPEMPVAAVR